MRIGIAALALLVAGVCSALALRGTAPEPSSGSEAMAVSSHNRSTPQLSAPGIKRLVVYGHSMPLGGGASDASHGYAALTAETLGIKLVNRAVGGSGASNATKTMEQWRPPNAQEAVVLHTGMNDVFRRGEAAVGRGRQAIRSFLAGTADAGRRVVVLECQPGSWKYTPRGVNLQPAYEAWNDMLREEAAAAGDVRLLGTCEGWNPRRFTNVQRYHPNDTGHARMAAELAELIAKP